MTGRRCGETALSVPDSQTKSASSEHRDSAAELRQKLWSAFIGTLNHSGIPYCLLGATGVGHASGDADVDFAVRPSDFAQVPQLLATAAASVGGHVIQAIEHETTATYFAVAIQRHGRVAFLHPDCTTDYRRQGRLWMSSVELLGGTWRAPGSYWRPGPSVDFKYYLIKQLLKQTISDLQWKKLMALREAANDPREAFCFWPLATAAQIEEALSHNDRQLFRTLLPQLRRELTNTPAVENAPAKASALAHDADRIARRLAHPTGLFVQITGAGLQQRTELANGLSHTLAPAFRRASVMSISNPAGVVRDLIASTLVLSPGQASPYRALYGGLDIRWQPELAAGGNLEFAVSAILSHLSRRTARRLKLQSVSPHALELHNLAHTTAT